ncbi:potassium channel family protein [Phycicoccus sp. MAQZ13P-2]|uniref:potassium channel family protein n=1 Tax=Phycicoccus mangrovi TaxID=2840470 RepID=UPI001C0056D7|nr:potassium channel family protein [Phycicoccus mangrovi]MBT9257509.1 potassium channel family protein [Phycicoccus mangrovi]MBT9275822.1 potassium channel family protein [Phycicoccus mangrovi]
MSDDVRRARWESATEWPLTAAALFFLVAYAWPILDPTLSGGWLTALEVLSWTAWAAFLVDYLVRLRLASHKVEFVRHNLLDLAVVVLPLLRPLRLLRLVTLLAVLNRKAGGSLRGRVSVYVAGAAVMVILVASLAELQAERGAPGALIRTFGDALWWAATTVTTVGYGDLHPVTTQGRWVAVGLMLAGIALIGVVTATFASWLIEQVQDIEEASRAATAQDVETLSEQITRLQRTVDELRAERAADRPPTG